MYYLRTCAVTCGALRHAISVMAVSVLLYESGTLSAFVDKHCTLFIYIYIYICVCVFVSLFVFIHWVSGQPEVILVGIE
jgi:hypothetical protein